MKMERSSAPQSGHLLSGSGNEFRRDIGKGSGPFLRIVPISSTLLGSCFSMIVLLSVGSGEPALNEAFVILVSLVGIGDQPGGHAVDLHGDVLVGVGGGQGVPEIRVCFQTGKEGMTIQQIGEVATEEV